MQKITPFLWFDTNAEEAMEFYCSIFKNSEILSKTYNPEGGPMPAGTLLVGSFTLNGQKFMALNGGPIFKFSEAVSFVVNCETQEEVDHYWEKLSEGGDERAQQCGWLKDKYGNQNGGYANQALDVTRTLVGSDGFRSQSMTLSPGAVKVYVDPVGGSNASVSTAADLARIQSIGTPALTHKFAQDTIIASGLQHAGCWIMYIQGKTETRDHTAPYPIIDIDGPSPAFPSLLGVCGAGGGAATARALMSLSNAATLSGPIRVLRILRPKRSARSIVWLQWIKLFRGCLPM